MAMLVRGPAADDPHPLHDAALEGDLDGIAAALAAGTRPDERDWIRRTALHRAASSGNVPAIEALLDAGATIDALSGRNKTPLILAVLANKRAAVKALIDGGADLEVGGAYGETALYYATSPRLSAVMRLLLDAGANVEATNVGGRTAMYVAILANEPDAVATLLSRGARTDVVDVTGRTAVEFLTTQPPYAILPVRVDANLARMLMVHGTPVSVAQGNPQYSDLAAHTAAVGRMSATTALSTGACLSAWRGRVPYRGLGLPREVEARLAAGSPTRAEWATALHSATVARQWANLMAPIHAATRYG